MRATIKGLRSKDVSNLAMSVLVPLDVAILLLSQKIDEFKKEIKTKCENDLYGYSVDAWHNASPKVQDDRTLAKLQHDLAELKKFKRIYMLSDEVRLEPDEVNLLCAYIDL